MKNKIMVIALLFLSADIICNISISTAAQVYYLDPPASFICEVDNICIPIEKNGSNVSVTVGPIGTYQSGHACYSADTSGLYEIKAIASKECGSDPYMAVVDVTINNQSKAGYIKIEWDALHYASGVYFYHLVAG